MTTDEFWGRELYYIDGITKVTDPFWKSVCRKCGHTYLACLSTTECPQCGGMDVDRWLGGVPYDQIVEERGKTVFSESE